MVARADRRVPGRLETLGLAASICVLSQGFLPVQRFFSGEVDAPGSSDALSSGLEGGTLAVLLLLAVAGLRRVRPIWWEGVPAALLWIYCVASAFWSDNPETTCRRSLLLLSYLVFGHVAVGIIGTERTLRLLNRVSWFMLAASVALFIGLPSLGRDVGDYDGALRGIFVQKNVAAWAFELALAYLGYRLYAERRLGAMRMLGAGIIVGAIVLTRSTTGVIASMALICFWLWSCWFRRPRLRLLAWWVAAAALAGAVFAFALLGDNAYGLIGKDPTLNGRGPIWEAARGLIAARPWLGYGFQGFWLPGDRAVEQIWANIGWHAPHAHNGLLELLIETGVVGLALYGVLVGKLLLLVVRGLRRDDPVAWWTVSWMMLVVLKGMTEPAYLTLDMATALLSFSTVALHASEQRVRSGAPVPAARPRRRHAPAWA